MVATRVAARRDGASEKWLVVARGHAELRRELERLFGEIPWVHVIEDRRLDGTLLPRGDRRGHPPSGGFRG